MPGFIEKDRVPLIGWKEGGGALMVEVWKIKEQWCKVSGEAMKTDSD